MWTWRRLTARRARRSRSDDLVTVGDTVEITTECRSVDFQIVVDAKTETEEMDACRGPDGGWQRV